MAQELSWKDAIKAVLASAKSPMHYTDIVEEIAKRGLKNYRGATPANTVSAQISTSIKDEGAESPFVRLGPGLYALREFGTSTIISTAPDELETDSELSAPAGLVNAFGMFWDRSKVNWTSRPALYGQQPESTQKTDFSDQKGVYLLYDGREVVYVGRVTDSTLGKRLLVHTTDRLNGRWNRFSWFGVYPVEEGGTLKKDAQFSHLDVDVVIITMEAVLIEGLEPRQNRKRGDADFKAFEFLQVEDPEFEKRKKLRMLQEMMESSLLKNT